MIFLGILVVYRAVAANLTAPMGEEPPRGRHEEGRTDRGVAEVTSEGRIAAVAPPAGQTARTTVFASRTYSTRKEEERHLDYRPPERID